MPLGCSHFLAFDSLADQLLCIAKQTFWKAQSGTLAICRLQMQSLIRIKAFPSQEQNNLSIQYSSISCLQNNPNITQWRESQNPVIKNMSALEQYFERRVLDLAAAAGRSYIVWQEILDNNVKVWIF